MTYHPAGRLIGIAWRNAVRAPMQEIDTGRISIERGLEGDHKGPKFPRRQITVLAKEAWEQALSQLKDADGGPVRLPWTTRRANLLVEGIGLPKARGAILRIGPVRLEVTNPTQPCNRMEEAFPGLLKALHPDWRGGVTCRVLESGDVKIGDDVEILLSPPEHVIRLP